MQTSIAPPHNHRRKYLKPALLTVASVILLIAALLALMAKTIERGAKAYLYGLPLVVMDLTRETFTHTFDTDNRLVHLRGFPDPSFKEVVRPNVDTLYSTSFIDMADGPFVFTLEPNHQRYSLMPFLDAWTNVFASLGTRTTGSEGGVWLLVGPDWEGQVPEGLKLLRAPTRIVWLVGRIQTNGKDDYTLVHRLQDGIDLRPLADWRAGRTGASVDAPSSADELEGSLPPPIERLHQMPTQDFFQRLADLMVDNPPAPADDPMLDALKQLGVQPGKPVEWGPLDHLAIHLGRLITDYKMNIALAPDDVETIGGWHTPPSVLGDYGTQYDVRAVVAIAGLGANEPEDAMYPSAEHDANGDPLSGSERYRLHFEADQIPPVHAFWSITAYGVDNFLMANSANRYAVTSRDPLHYNADGSLDILIQADAPSPEHRANWLPVRDGELFFLTTRLFWPKAAALNGDWTMPPLEPRN